MVAIHELLGPAERVKSLLPQLPLQMVEPILRINNALVVLMPNGRLEELGRLGRTEIIRRRINGLYERICADFGSDGSETISFNLSSVADFENASLPYPVERLVKEYLKLDGEGGHVKIGIFSGVEAVEKVRGTQLSLIVWRGNFVPGMILTVEAWLRNGGEFGIGLEDDGRLSEQRGALSDFREYLSMLGKPDSAYAKYNDILQIIDWAATQFKE